MGSHIEQERTLCDGRVRIYQRTDVEKASWHCRISFPKQPPIRQSLYTTNEKDAERLAVKLYEDMRYRYERGLSLKRMKFEEVLASYFTHLEQEVANGIAKQDKLTTHRIMSRYCLEYFSGKLIDMITTSDIKRFHEWRRVYWITGPGSKVQEITYNRGGKKITSKRRPARAPAVSTSNSENVLLRAVFNHATSNDWMSEAQKPKIETKIPHDKKGRDAKRRPGLDRIEVMKLLAVSRKRMEPGIIHDHLYHQRFMLHTFVGLMAFAGMRPFEAMNLKLKDIVSFVKDGDNQYWKIYVSGKNKARWLIPLEDISEFLDELFTYIMERRSRTSSRISECLELDDTPIFVDHDGVKLKSLAAEFKNLLKEANLYIDPETGKARDSYCLRHYYATERLLAGVSIYTLAENMGTSVQMIQQHYGHLRPEMAAAELTKGWGG